MVPGRGAHRPEKHPDPGVGADRRLGPAAANDLGFISAYVFGAVCPGEGKAAAVIMPICNTIAMNHHLREISSQVGTAAHALLVLTPAPAEAEGAGWHDSQALAIPDNISLLALPPYSPGHRQLGIYRLTESAMS